MDFGHSLSFFCGSRDGSEGVWVSGFPSGTWHAASRGKEDGQNGRTNVFFLPRILGGFLFLYIGNSVFVDPVRGPNKTLNKNILLNNKEPAAGFSI
jgi:hypothetical protein